MNERELQVLEQYPFAVEGSCRIRGAFLLDTSVGKRLIREFSGSAYRLEREQELLEYLRERGFLVDRIEPDRRGACLFPAGRTPAILSKNISAAESAIPGARARS